MIELLKEAEIIDLKIKGNIATYWGVEVDEVEKSYKEGGYK